MGGEAFLIKLKRSFIINELLIPGAPKQMKMACGENPKRVYGPKGIPMSRMGEGWLFRRQFHSAKYLMEKQRNWCAGNRESENFPKDPAMDSLIALLLGYVRLHVHCYTVLDLQTFLDISNEFNISISAFHHALEAYRIPSLIKSRDITVATFADLGWYKKEAYNASVKAPKLLQDSGVKVALKSDHPVTHAGELIQQASKAVHYGLDRRAAIAAVTSIPAAAAGLGSRTGSIRVGLDADLLVWNTNDALEIGARPDKIFIDGELVEDYQLSSLVNSQQRLTSTRSDQWHDRPQVTSSDQFTCSTSDFLRIFDCYAIVDVDIWTEQNYQPNPNARNKIVVSNGIITCVGLLCTLPADCQTFRLESGLVTPGFVHAGSSLGLIEIDQEDSMNDGSSASDGVSGANSLISPVDGIRFDSIHMKAALFSGITTAIIRPAGNWQFITGSTDAYYTCCGSYLKPEGIIQRNLGLNVRIGNSVKNGELKSISSQIAKLRSLLKEASNSGTGPFDQVIARSIPLVIEVDQLDAIIAVLKLRAVFNIRLILLSAGEVHLAIPELVKAGEDVSVLFFSSLQPDDPSRIRFRFDTPSLLQDAGISYAIATQGPDDHRNLRWFAGRTVAAGLNHQQAMKAIITAPSRMFGLTPSAIAVGATANLVLFNDDPLDYSSQIQLVAVGNQVHCKPKQS